MNRLRLMSLWGAIALAGCSTVLLPDQPIAPLQPGETVLCETSDVAIRTGYATSRANDCQVLSERQFVLDIRPEAEFDPNGRPINESPWYGFRVVPKSKGSVSVKLNYDGGYHRYNPKVSRDGQTWIGLPLGRVTDVTNSSAGLNLNPGAEPLFVSAQEVFTPDDHYAWTEMIGEREDATVTDIGQSAQGRSLWQIDIQSDPNKPKPYVVIVGRQHPPEITGAFALTAFVERILDGSDLSDRFLEQYNLLIIPMINPDGVVNGHWRFNTGGMDLNRDWGPFTQVETQVVRAALDRFHTGEDEIDFFLDFHSTKRNLLYTQTDDEPTTPVMFARDWTAAVKARLDPKIYPFKREPSRNTGQPNSKNYMYERFGISAITYEVGDKTDRTAIKDAAIVFSEEMMTLLLETSSTP